MVRLKEGLCAAYLEVRKHRRDEVVSYPNEVELSDWPKRPLA
jgi:hypothetical protein